MEKCGWYCFYVEKSECWFSSYFYLVVFVSIGYIKKKRGKIIKMWLFVVYERIMFLVFFFSIIYIFICYVVYESFLVKIIVRKVCVIVEFVCKMVMC